MAANQRIPSIRSWSNWLWGGPCLGSETFVHKYFEEFAGIFKWRQAVVGRAKAEKQVRTRIGRVINVADDVTDNSFFN
jgi:hypothetical protein